MTLGCHPRGGMLAVVARAVDGYHTGRLHSGDADTLVGWSNKVT